MRRNAVLAGATVLALGSGTVFAPSALAAGWRNISSSALKYDGSLDRVDFASKSVGWAVGASGSLFSPTARIVRWTGTSWTGQTSPVGFAPTDVAAASASRAWIVGYNLTGPVSVYWNGTKWTQVSFPLVGLPTQVSAGTDGAAYAITGVDVSSGGPAAILRWTGSGWLDPQVPLPASTSIVGVDVRSRSDVWLAGTTSNGTTVTGLVVHYDGKTWKQIKVPGSLGTPTNRAVLTRIVANSSTNVYVLRAKQNAQSTNALLHYDGKTWKTANVPGTQTPVGLSSDGAGGAIVIPATSTGKTTYYRYDGTTWTTAHGPSRAGTLTVGDADARPGTTGIASAGTSNNGSSRAPFIEYLG
ncbi:hypothetical protein [Actinomadura rayongensis]|uniref:Uncharacterized protein n=1 Tax=Actinomadura rayongensis TaxID=1429076 RepID=A0A6I4WDR3_9ACTN|nr:hypothetical protein [Actinomadura rayongensis]MXQ64832.1 hypothetical protein [Actinomadura rayongensis]